MARRTVHGITWTDDLAWMEAMKGAKWKETMRKQQQRWQKLVEPLSHNVATISLELESAAASAHAMVFRTADGLVEIGMSSGGSLRWKFKDSVKEMSATNLVALNDKGTNVWTIEDVGEGAELYAVSLYTHDNQRQWQHRGVSPHLAIVAGRCYCLEAKKKLTYWRLVSWDAVTGKDRKVHYEEKDYRYNLEIVRGDTDHAWLRRQAGGKEDCFMITKTLEPLGETGSIQSRRFLFGSHAGEYLTWTGKWTESPELQKAGYKLPFTQGREVPEQLNTKKGLMVTHWLGCRKLWHISRKAPVLLWRGYGSVLIDPWETCWIRINKPGADTYWFSSSEHRPAESLAWAEAGKALLATSADGTDIPFYILGPQRPQGQKPQGQRPQGQRPKALLVIGYGAYGLSTGLMTQRWEPLLRRGWALAIGMWRGGGDHTPEWADAGRCFGRSLVLEDAEAVVKAAQKAAEVPPTRTVLYGRSAGGLWVGGLLTKNSRLAGGAYMEVPYLDALRTTTNRSLPLTDIEADEFGLPERDISEFVDVASWSPMERIPAGGLPTFQIVRTAMNDSQVYAYESVKWTTRCGPSAYLAIEDGQGHFAQGSKNTQQAAQDLAILLSRFT